MPNIINSKDSQYCTANIRMGALLHSYHAHPLARGFQADPQVRMVGLEPPSTIKLLAIYQHKCTHCSVDKTLLSKCDRQFHVLRIRCVRRITHGESCNECCSAYQFGR